MKHIALEFDPTWACPEKYVPKGRRCTIEDKLLSFYKDKEVETLWFIDYGIRRRPDSHGSDQGYGGDRKVFYGNDYRFVEVQLGDLKDWMFHDGRDLNGGPDQSALHFLLVMKENCRGYFYYALAPNQTQSGHKYDLKTPCGAKMGVLACERMD